MWDNFYLGAADLVGTKTRIEDRYTEEQRLQAVLAMFSVNPKQPTSIEALEAARAVVGAEIATSTLDRWKHKYGARALAALNERKLLPAAIDDGTLASNTFQQLTTNFSRFLAAASDRFNDPEILKTANLRDLMLAVGIAMDKLKMITEISPELSAMTKEYAHLCNRLRLDPVVSLQDYMHILEQDYSPTAALPAIDVHAAAR